MHGCSSRAALMCGACSRLAHLWFYVLYFAICNLNIEVSGLWFVVCGLKLGVLGLWVVVCGLWLEPGSLGCLVCGLWFVV